MKRFLRVLIVLGGVLLLFFGTRTRGTAQIGTSDGSCCSAGNENTTPFLPCGSCTSGPYGNVDSGTCSYGASDVIATPCADPEDHSGSQSIFTGTTRDCVHLSSGCASGGWGTDACPTSYTFYYWADDPPNCTPTPTCGNSVGASCNGSNPCCSAYTCLGGTCQSCSPYYNQSCTPSGASSACGVTTCDGSCAAECFYNSNCGPGNTCNSGCCQSGGGGGGGGGDGGDGDCGGPGACGSCVPEGDNCFQDCDCGDDGYGDQMVCGESGDCETSGYEDPILIDLGGSGYQLTDVHGGVQFDMLADRKLQQVAWTSTGSNVGLLALDRNGNGRIDGSAELFTGLSPQRTLPGYASDPSVGRTGTALSSLKPVPPTSKGGRGTVAAKPNGFSALAVYDQRANGGNDDGQIDARDAVFSKLLVWVDLNHNGVSDPGELLGLAQLGISSISLSYELSPWVDVYGNRFSSKTSITRNGATQWIYDVYLRLAK